MPETVALVIHDRASPVSAAVLEVLADWAAAGWVDEHVVLDLAEAESRGNDIAGMRVMVVPSGGAEAATSQPLSDQLDHRRVRLVVVDPLGCDDSWDGSRDRLTRVAGRLYQALMGKRSGALDIVIPWQGTSWPASLERWHGWDTIVVAPETSTNVAEEGLPLHVDVTDPGQARGLGAHAAGFIATIGGLWSGLPESPFDDTPQSDDLRMGRSFYRRMDAAAVAERLRSHVLDIKCARGPDARSSDAQAPIVTVVDKLKGEIEVLPAPSAPTAPPPKSISVLEAIKEFFRYMFGALVKSPRELAQGWSYRAKRSTAERMQRMIYGADSQRVISVGGVAADGLPPSLPERDQRLAALRGRLPALDDGLSGSSAAGQRRFWGLCFDTAWTLASGTQHGPVPPVMDAGFAQYYAPHLVAPALPKPWTPDGGLAIDGLAAEVPIHDVRAVRHAAHLLSHASADPTYGSRPAAERNAKALQDVAAGWASSFFGRIGTMVANGIDHFDASIDRALARLAELAQPDSDEADRIANRLSRFSRWFTVAVAVVSVALTVLTVLGLVVVPLAFVLPILGIGYLVVMFTRFWTLQRQIFQLRNKARLAESDSDRLLRELPVLIENSHRMRQLYRQYLVWSQAASAFLTEPFGRPSAGEFEQRGMVGHLPKSVACGVYRVADEPAAQSLCAQVALGLRQSLSSLWDTFVEEGLRKLVMTKPQFQRIKAEDIFGEFETTADGALRSWLDESVSSATEGPRVAPAVAAALDVRQMDRLVTGISDQQLRALLAVHEVELIGDGARALPTRLSLEGRLAPFHRDAFTADGMRNREVDRSASVQLRSAVMRGRDTRHWFDEVDALLVLTGQLMIHDLSLDHAEPADLADAPVAVGAGAPAITDDFEDM